MRSLSAAFPSAEGARVPVEQPVAAEFTRRLAETMSGLPLGPGLDPGVRLGPLVNAESRDKVAQLVTDTPTR
jgi:succinate-semialdehyde dehydrogenase/glutarate-semialdehyde dehydrogenase